MTTNLDRFRFPPFGLADGAPAARSALYLIRGEDKRALPSKSTNMLLQKGDIIRLETSGGGGFGNPATRPREQVARDIRLGYVSAAAATDAFGNDRLKR